MKRFLSILSLCALMAAQSASADIYYVNIDLTKPIEFIKKILCSDWDTVIADDSGAFGKFFAGLGVVPFGKTMRILKHQGFEIIRTMKSARHDGQPLKGLAANIDRLIELEPLLAPYREKLMRALNDASPHAELIAYYQCLQAQGVPLIVATNSDYKSLMIKTVKLNTKLCKKGRKKLTYAACYCGGSCPEIKDGRTPNGMPAGSVWLGKDSDEYFEKLFRFAETEFGCDRKDTLFIFVDDLEKNIHRACRVAQREGVSLLAIHKNRSDKRIVQELQIALHTIKTKTYNLCIGKKLKKFKRFVLDGKTGEFINV